MLEKRDQMKNKSRFLSHSFFPFIIVIVIIILLCYHDYYNYHFVYRHRDNQYLCLHFYHVVECPNITFKNSRYIISVDGWYWHLNRDICQSQGGDLVSIETEEEWNFINNEIQRRNTSSCKNKWSIGLMKEDGNWTWVNGKPLTVSKWGQGEPSGEHDVGFMYKRFSNDKRGLFGSVNKEIWTNQHAYICEISNGELTCRCCFFFLKCSFE